LKVITGNQIRRHQDANASGDLDILTNSVTLVNQSGGPMVIDAGGLTTSTE
jgi:hypothetical protein